MHAEEVLDCHVRKEEHPPEPSSSPVFSLKMTVQDATLGKRVSLTTAEGHSSHNSPVS